MAGRTYGAARTIGVLEGHPRVTAGRRAEIASLIGEPATILVYRQTYWLRTGAGFLLFVFIGLLLVGAAKRFDFLFPAIGILFFGVAACGVRGAMLGRGARQAASEFVSRQVGRPVTVPSEVLASGFGRGI